jgi:hypothetical protein
MEKISCVEEKNKSLFFKINGIDYEIRKKPNNKQKSKKEKGIFFVNDITEEVKKSYEIGFKENAIKEISILLNQHYKTTISSEALKELISHVLTNYGYNTERVDAVYGYIKYFCISGLLEKDKNNALYTIIRSNLIPKSKRKTGGFLDELGMS